MTVKFQGGCFCDLFLTEAELLNRFTGQELFTSGFNTFGQLGTSDRIDRCSPIQTVSSTTDWSFIGAGNCSSGGIKTDGTLWLWGTGTCGRHGNLSVVSRSSPVQTIAGGTNWKSLDLGICHSGAVKTDGTLWVWGSGRLGSLGTNASTGTSSPVQTISAGTNWKLVALGWDATLGIKTDGTLWGWGDTSLVGDGTPAVAKSSPVQTVAGGTNWKCVDSKAIHTTSIKTDGTLWNWGFNGNGELGIGNFVSFNSSPVQTVSAGTNWKKSVTGCYNTAAIKTDGSLWLWGSNLRGQLGTGDDYQQNSPVQTISGGFDWREVGMGSQFVTAIKSDGSLWVWGESWSGMLGTGSTAYRSSPVQTITRGNSWRCALGGDFHTLALRVKEF